MAKRTEEQFRYELSIKQPNLIPNDTYKNNRTKYHCVCKIHKCDVYKEPYKMLSRNQGCKLCGIENSKYAMRYTDETYKQKVSEVNENITITSKYSGMKNRVDALCNICGHTWYPIAESLVSTTPCGCPKCSGNAIKTTEEFASELKISHPYLELLSDYVRSNQEVHIFCHECGEDFWIKPNKLQQGQMCSCHYKSNGEIRIQDYLEKNNISFITPKTYEDLLGVSGYRKLSYDFYLPKYNLLVEFQGQQHEKPIDFEGSGEENARQRFEKQQEHDRRKREYASNNDVKLLEIWYWDFDNIEKILNETLI